MFLGVDGGGSKTAFCVLDERGSVRARARTESLYYFSEGIELVERVLERGVREICETAGIDKSEIAGAFFGLPGYGEASADLNSLDAIPGGVLGHDRYACGNDMICGWAGSLGAVDGINIISGTGSMTYGERGGFGVRVGGWGELFGDEGSAYWIATRGLNAFTRMSDGRLEPGPLYETILNHLDLEGDLDLIDIVLNRWKGSRSEIAALSRVVVEAAEAGDECAAEILSEAAGELAELVHATRRQLDFAAGEKVPVSYSGGMFTSGVMLDLFGAALTEGYDQYELRKPLFAPDIGAALYAARLFGKRIDPEDIVTSAL
ncbi:N-acetylglucosamine kinase [Rubrobacter indicoceani]|uniref:N-acetylglucosamine kinase n=1 Tax=Rubrobacter indicoceani TaxID=2051957 RepID=UPI000E5C1A76|nr:BadF/BadG/BcrA/BcrD ATPase family protein [Rubrobacter indicoceani]